MEKKNQKILNMYKRKNFDIFNSHHTERKTRVSKCISDYCSIKFNILSKHKLCLYFYDP